MPPLDVPHGVANCTNTIVIGIGNGKGEFILKFHDQLNNVERIGAKVVERSLGTDFVGGNGQLLRQDVPELLKQLSRLPQQMTTVRARSIASGVSEFKVVGCSAQRALARKTFRRARRNSHINFRAANSILNDKLSSMRWELLINRHCQTECQGR